MSNQTSIDLREKVRSKYAAAARAVLEPRPGVTAQSVELSATDSCCGSSATGSCCGGSSAEAVGGFSENLYREGETDGVPEEAVRSRYAEAARAVLEPKPGVTAQSVESAGIASCCGGAATDSCCGSSATEPCCGATSAAEAVGGFSGNLYREGETDGLPEEAVLASLGCGNPIAVADLHEGERVLDLGSGGGIDVLLSARRVGLSGFAYGVDMTDDMLALARANAAKAGASNVDFLKGEIEDLPLPDAAVDVVISNCVINLSTDKPAVLAEMFRVLAPGGRIGITDVAVSYTHLTLPTILLV